MAGGIDEGAREGALFVLGWEVDTSVVEVDDGDDLDVVLLEVTGVRRSEVGSERLLITTDDWDDIARAVDEAVGGERFTQERERRWDRFAGRLQCGISALDPGERLILHSGLGLFVAVEVDDDGIGMETTFELDTDVDHDPLVHLGWHAPDEDHDRHGLELEANTPSDVVANIVLATLRGVHGVGEAEELTYEAWHRDGRRIVIPTLGLSRRTR